MGPIAKTADRAAVTSQAVQDRSDLPTHPSIAEQPAHVPDRDTIERRSSTPSVATPAYGGSHVHPALPPPMPSGAARMAWYVSQQPSNQLRQAIERGVNSSAEAERLAAILTGATDSDLHGLLRDLGPAQLERLLQAFEPYPEAHTKLRNLLIANLHQFDRVEDAATMAGPLHIESDADGDAMMESLLKAHGWNNMEFIYCADAMGTLSPEVERVRRFMLGHVIAGGGPKLIVETMQKVGIIGDEARIAAALQQVKDMWGQERADEVRQALDALP